MNSRLFLVLLVACAALVPRGARGEPANDAVAKALGGQGFPWYDSEADRLKPVRAEKGSWRERLRSNLIGVGRRINRAVAPVFRAIDRFFTWTGRRFNLLGAFSLGQALATMALFSLLILAVIALVLLYRRVDSFDSSEPSLEVLGGIAGLADAPLGARATPAEWWRLALERRAASDLSGAVIALFVYQLVTLERRGLLRFSPGRTGRNYVRDLQDDRLAGQLGRSLALFEQVYYGRRWPSEPAFERVWAEVERFHQSSTRGKP